MLYNLLTIQVYCEMGLVFLLNYWHNHAQNDLQEVAMDIDQHWELLKFMRLLEKRSFW